MSSQRYISDALKRKKQKVKKIKRYAILTLILAVLGGILYVLQLPAFQISEIRINGDVFVERSEIENKANQILNKKIIGIIPISNIFIFPKHELAESIKQNPAILSVKIRKDFFQTITIDIVEQEKEIIYCADFEKTNCYYVNKEGFIYAHVDEMIIPEQEIILFDEKETKQVGDTILDQETYIDFVLFVKNLTRYDIKIKEIYMKQDLTVEFQSRRGARLITSVFDNFEKDFSNLVALFEQNILTQDQLAQIEYIDLRFGNKVFYKNKTN